MTIGIPKEIMPGEGRIAITPKEVKNLVKAGNKVIIQSQAGKEAGFSDEDFAKAGALLKAGPSPVYQADLLLKVKEPQPKEYSLLKKRGILFAFLHLPANPKLLKVLLEKKITGIAYEGVQLKTGERPLLRPMSEIAGKRAVEEGIYYLKQKISSQTITVAILGAAGAVGQAALKEALASKARVIALDLPEKLSKIQSKSYRTPTVLTQEISTPKNIEKAIKKADLLVGAVAIPGSKALKLVTRKMIKSMKPGSVIVDVAIDEGGCVETSRPTTYHHPIFIEEKVIHYCVKNIPGAIPQISTPALTSAILPYLSKISSKGFKAAVKENPALLRGVYTFGGKITNPKLAQVFGKKYTPLKTLL